MGVVFPVAIMGGVSLLFGFKPIPAAFIGVVFSATSVSISVAVLKEAGLLDSKEGVSILGAAVADDVIGVILLSVMCTLVNTGSVDVAGLGLILLKQQRLRGGRGPVYRAGWRHVVRAGVLRGHRPADHRRG